MVKAIGIINRGLDEVLRTELRDFNPKNFTVRIRQLEIEGRRRCLVLTEVNGEKSQRSFISVYDGNKPFVFLVSSRYALDEMFACPVEIYFEDTLIYG